MNAIDTIRALARGERPGDGLLPTARLEAGTGIAYGEEAIVAHLRAAPLSIGEDATIVRASGHLAIFDGDRALVADLYGEDIARLWRLGDQGVEAEPTIGVPFDADLRQARGDVAFRAADHPALSADAAAGVEMAGRALARDHDPAEQPAAYRVRVFVVRAFGDADRAAALFAIYRLGGDVVRSAGFTWAAAVIDVDGARIVRDRAGEAAVVAGPWRASVA